MGPNFSNWHLVGKYGVIKTVTATHIINAFSAIGATNIVDGYLIFTDLPSGHQAGDKYYIKMEQGSSSTSYTGTLSVGDTVQGYTRELSANSYNQSAPAAELVAETFSFDSLDIVGRKIRFWLPTNSTVPVWAQNISVTADKIYYSDGNYYMVLGIYDVDNNFGKYLNIFETATKFKFTIKTMLLFS